MTLRRPSRRVSPGRIEWALEGPGEILVPLADELLSGPPGRPAILRQSRCLRQKNIWA